MELVIAPVTYALIVANILVSCWALFCDRKFIDQFAFNITGIGRHGQSYRIFTSSFLHADPMHLLFNMMTLFFFGPQVEAVLGKLGFLVVYFGAVLASGIFTFYIKRSNFNYTSIGASDATCGILFAFILMAPFAKMYVFPIPFEISAWAYGIIFILISSFLVGGENNRIAHESHLSGAAAGLVLTALMVPEVFTRLVT